VSAPAGSVTEQAQETVDEVKETATEAMTETEEAVKKVVPAENTGKSG